MTDRCYGCAHLYGSIDSFSCITYFCLKFKEIVGKDDGIPVESPPKPLKHNCWENKAFSQEASIDKAIQNELDYYQTYARQYGARAAWLVACDSIVKLRGELERIAKLLPDWEPGISVAYLVERRIRDLEAKLKNLLDKLPPHPISDAELGNAALEAEDALI